MKSISNHLHVISYQELTWVLGKYCLSSYHILQTSSYYHLQAVRCSSQWVMQHSLMPVFYVIQTQFSSDHQEFFLDHEIIIQIFEESILIKQEKMWDQSATELKKWINHRVTSLWRQWSLLPSEILLNILLVESLDLILGQINSSHQTVLVMLM